MEQVYNETVAGDRRLILKNKQGSRSPRMTPLQRYFRVPSTRSVMRPSLPKSPSEIKPDGLWTTTTDGRKFLQIDDGTSNRIWFSPEMSSWNACSLVRTFSWMEPPVLVRKSSRNCTRYILSSRANDTGRVFSPSASCRHSSSVDSTSLFRKAVFLFRGAQLSRIGRRLFSGWRFS